MLIRGGATLAGLTAMILVASLPRSAYYYALSIWGFTPFPVPFIDLEAALAAWDCTRLGIDVIVVNPCDILYGSYPYSPFWMTIAWIPLGRWNLAETGAGLAIAFLLSLSALPRAQSGSENILRIAAVLSTSVAFALERGNLDILIFLLVVLTLHLLVRSPPSRAVGYAAVFLAGLIKYYPFVLLALLMKERPRVRFAAATAAVIGLISFYYLYRHEILAGMPHIARGSPFGDMFAFKDTLLGLFVLLNDAIGSLQVAAFITLAAAAMGLFISFRLCAALWRTSDVAAALHRLDEPRRLPLLSGALLITGCYFAGQNIGYRAIFLLLALPGLAALGRDRSAGSLAAASHWATIGIPVLMWWEAVRVWIRYIITGSTTSFGTTPNLENPADITAWILREAGWWLLVAFFLTILLAYTLDTLAPNGWLSRGRKDPPTIPSRP